MVVDSQSQKVEIAQALTTDKAHKSIDAKTITPQQSSSKSVSFNSQDLQKALDGDSNQWILFHTHLEDLNHANVHSQQDEKQHSLNAKHYNPNSKSEIFNCLGNGIVWVRKDGGFSLKARSTNDNNLITFSHDGVEAEELVFDKEGQLIWQNKESSLNPEDNNQESWDFDPAA